MDSKTVVFLVDTFEMGSDKEAALKPLEEAAEVYAAWQEVDNSCRPSACSEECDMRGDCDALMGLSYEIADCIQACVNLAARQGIDLGVAMRDCRVRNQMRGRYDA